MSSAMVYLIPAGAVVLLLGSALNPLLSLTMAMLLLGVQVGRWPGASLKFAPSDIFLLFALLGMFLNRKTRSAVFERAPTRWWFLALLSLYVIGNFITVVNIGNLLQRQLINRNIGLLVVFAYYYSAVVLIDSRERLERMLKLYIYTGFILNAISLLGYFAYRLVGIGGFFVTQGTRLIGFIQDPSAWGCFLLPLFFLQGILLLHRSPLLSPRFSIINLVLLSMGIFFTVSRSTYLALFLVFLLFLILQRRSLLFLPFLALSALCIYFIFQAFGAGFQKEMVNSLFWKVSIYERLTANTIGILWFLRSPIWGGGMGSFYKSSAYSHMELPLELTKYGWDYPHNTYVWFLAEGGLLGIFILLGLFLNFLRGAGRASKELPPPQNALALGIYFALCAFFAMGLGIDIFQRRDMWLFFAFADLVRYLPEEE